MKIVIYILVTFLSLNILFGCKNSLTTTDNNSNTSFQNLNQIITQKFEIEDKLDGFINEDSYRDEIYVIRMLNSNQRHFIVCYGLPDDQFRLVVNSKNVIKNYASHLDEDPFLELKMSTGGFSVVHRNRLVVTCQDEAKFEYEPKSDAILLQSVKRSDCKMASKIVQSESIKTIEDFGKIKLEDFNILKNY